MTGSDISFVIGLLKYLASSSVVSFNFFLAICYRIYLVVLLKFSLEILLGFPVKIVLEIRPSIS